MRHDASNSLCSDSRRNIIRKLVSCEPTGGTTTNRCIKLCSYLAAAAAGQPETVRRLLDQGADVNARSSALHDRTAIEAAIWHRENDIVRIIAVPGDVPGGSLRNGPLDPDGMVKDEDYREVIGMLRQATKDEATKKSEHKVRPHEVRNRIKNRT